MGTESRSAVGVRRLRSVGLGTVGLLGPLADAARDSEALHKGSPDLHCYGQSLPIKRSSPMTAMPSGTVAFLFTDIEGSTKRWQRDAQAMAGAVARHDDLMRAAIAARGGHVFKTVGDAFC